MAVVENLEEADVVAISDEAAEDKDKAVGVKYTRVTQKKYANNGR